MHVNRPENRRHAWQRLPKQPALAGLAIVIAALAVVFAIKLLTRSSAPTTQAPDNAADSTAQLQTRILATPDAEHPETFTEISGVRELRDGRVLLVDSRERSVQILDLGNGRSERIGRMGKGPGEYTLPVALIPLAGDSSGIVDEATGRILVVLPDGTTGDVFPMHPPGGAEGGGGESRLGGADSRGALYARGPNHSRVGGRFVRSDSVPIIRWTPGQERADTVTWTRQQATTVSESMRGQAHVISVGIDPFKGQDQWAVALDGRVAVADPINYQIRYTDPAGVHTVTPPIAFTPEPFTEAHKEEWRARQRRGVTVMVNEDDGTATVRPYRPGREEERQQWPEFLPPFLMRALKFAPDGNLWVQRTGPAGMGPTFDLIDPQGRVIQQVVLPAQTRLVAFGRNGAVYVARTDDDDLEHLQRYRLN